MGSLGPSVGDKQARTFGPGTVWTQEQADSRLAHVLQSVGDVVDSLVKVNINPNQRAALIDFAYNLGTNGLARSTLLEKLNAGDVEGAASEFDKWVMAARKGNAGTGETPCG